MKFYLLAMCILLFFTMDLPQVASQIPSPAGGQIAVLRNQSITSGGTQTYTNSFLYQGGYILFSIVPCFGEFDWYVGIEYIPNATIYAYNFPWLNDGASQTFGWNSSFTDYTIYIAVIGKNQYGSTSALFDLISYYDVGTGPAQIPTPGSVKGSVGSGGTSGTVSITPTGNSNDNYTAYYRIGGAGGGNGYYPYSACSVRLWLNQFTSNQGTFSGRYSVTANNLSPSEEFTITWIVDRRNGGYSAAYKSYTINSSAVLLNIPILLMAVSFLLSLM